jgi:LysR family glycine cleavage system transcriptional activator
VNAAWRRNLGLEFLFEKRYVLVLFGSFSKDNLMRLPSLNAMRAFEAAARQGSFARAAEELHVTAAAISQQVRGLETELDMPLFERMGRRLKLTDDGRAYAAGLADGFARISAATVATRAGVLPQSRLRITLLGSFAFGWLNARLPDFRLRHPDIDLFIDTGSRLYNLRRGDADIAIRYGVNWADEGLIAERFLEEDVFPVCSPALLNGPEPMRRLKDVTGQTLIHDQYAEQEGNWISWEPWFALAGIQEKPSTGLTYSATILINQAAIQGQGVAIGRSALVDEALTQGLLVRPFDVVRPSDSSYWLVMTPEMAETRAASAFRRWLFEIARESAGGGRAPKLPPA